MVKSLQFGAVMMALGSVFGAGAVARAGTLAPELPVAATATGQPFNLEDLRGQTVVLCFYDDEAT
jgi:hypothetical protein